MKKKKALEILARVIEERAQQKGVHKKKKQRPRRKTATRKMPVMK